MPDDPAVVKMLALLVKEPPRPSAVSSEPEIASGPSAAALQPADKSVEPISTATIAEIYIRQGFLVKALKVYRDLLRADPQNEQLRQKLIALKAMLAGAGSEERADVFMAPEATSPEPTSHDAAPVTLITETVITESTPSPESVCRSIVDIFAGWLDSVSRRREAHVS
jgi:hypothetical protein